MKRLLLLITLAVPTILFAQKTGNLTVFSENGDKFFLVLNGEKQNDKPQTNIRVEELPQPYYSAKIIFVDSNLATITKNLQITDVDNKMMDVTYRIRKDKAGKVKLNPYSAIEVQPDFVAPEGMYVHHFGHIGNSGGITQTTTTTTNSNTVDASVSVPGVSMNISINDPNEVSTTTTTTTTSHNSHSSHTNTTNTNNDDQPVTDNNCRGWAMKQADFTAAKKTISDASFEETKLSTAKSIVSANCLSCDQVVAICNLFSFEDSKLKFAKYAYKYTIDPKNYFKVNNVFSFDSSKEELSKFISGE
jgi:hypothetical protein